MKIENAKEAKFLLKEMEQNEYYLNHVTSVNVLLYDNNSARLDIPVKLAEKVNGLLFRAAKEYEKELISQIEQL